MIITTSKLEPVTEEAQASLGSEADVRMTVFPFRIGRESRAPNALATIVADIERRVGISPPLNDLYLLEQLASPFLQISREHCAIERMGDEFFLVDRGSACGSAVIAAHVTQGHGTIETSQTGGARRGGRLPLHDGDLVVIGTTESPYVFRFLTVLEVEGT